MTSQIYLKKKKRKAESNLSEVTPGKKKRA